MYHMDSKGRTDIMDIMDNMVRIHIMDTMTRIDNPQGTMDHYQEIPEIVIWLLIIAMQAIYLQMYHQGTSTATSTITARNII